MAVEKRGRELVESGYDPIGPDDPACLAAVRAIAAGKAPRDAAISAKCPFQAVRRYLESDDGAACYRIHRESDSGRVPQTLSLTQNSVVRPRRARARNSRLSGEGLAEKGSALISAGLSELESAGLSPQERLAAGAALVKLGADISAKLPPPPASLVSGDDIDRTIKLVRSIVYHTLLCALDRPQQASRALESAARYLGKPSVIKSLRRSSPISGDTQ